MINPVFTLVTGTNADLIAEVSKLYLRPNDIIADVTYGGGRFWKKTDAEVIGSDLVTGHGVNLVADFRSLPYADKSIDVVVLDPPYAHDPGRRETGYTYNTIANCYNNVSTTLGMGHTDIMRLYRKGLAEARRVLVPGGRVWVKCQDEIENHAQEWSHIAIYNMALKAKLWVDDLFVLASGEQSVKRWSAQRHAKKTHSYLWVFRR